MTAKSRLPLVYRHSSVILPLSIPIIHLIIKCRILSFISSDEKTSKFIVQACPKNEEVVVQYRYSSTQHESRTRLLLSDFSNYHILEGSSGILVSCS
jgi:hypothetical protein